ncbi:MAG: amino acid ABC transporter substrate-binding protein [Anaerolineales bacterium]|nr:amino acid ABC transporter substrate-binding protein [Anaerolineales bacterium]
MTRKFLIPLTLFLMAFVFAACSSPEPAPAETEAVATEAVEAPTEVPAAPTGNTLQTVMDRGMLVCGGNQAVPGFGFLNEDGSFSGFDIDYCHALAAALFGDASKVEIRPTTAQERFTALQTGEIDVLIRNTTWTLTRDTELGLNFTATTFYDGQGMMVRGDSGITTMEQLDGATICVQAGTTTELNLADTFSSRNLTYTPLVFDTADEVAGAYEEGRCDGFTTDISGLVSRRTILADPSAHIILEEVMSKEPLGPSVRHGDDQWYDIVQWVVFATMQAEELGVNSSNVDEMLASDNPSIRFLLGVEGDMGLKLGLANNWAYNVIKLVGNYGEIYDRNLGPETPTYIPRGINSLWTDGGLIYAPPIR